MKAILKHNNRQAIFLQNLKDFCHFAKEDDFIEATEWTNGEGFDVAIITDKRGENFSLSYGEWRGLKKIIKKLEG